MSGRMDESPELRGLRNIYESSLDAMGERHNARAKMRRRGGLAALRELETAVAALDRARLVAPTNVAVSAITRALVAIEDAMVDLNRASLHAATACHCLPYGAQVTHVAPPGPLHQANCHLYRP